MIGIFFDLAYSEYIPTDNPEKNGDDLNEKITVYIL